MKTWEEFIQYNNATNTEFNAIYYGLKEQGVLEEFLEEWNGRWTLSGKVEHILDSCLLWGATKKGSNFWVEENAKFIRNFKKYLSINTKKPSIYKEI